MKTDEAWEKLGDAFAKAYADMVIEAVTITPADVQKAKETYNPNLWNDIAWQVYLEGTGKTRAEVEAEIRAGIEELRSRK